MARHFFPFTRDYLQDWTVKHALRELIANAIDGEQRSGKEMSIKWARRNDGTLIIKNDATKLPINTLLLGFSQSRNRDDCIGTHGEGSILAYLVLAREGVDVKVYNDDESWVPSFAVDPDKDAEVLCIKTHSLSKTSYGAFIIEIRGIDKEMYEDIQTWFLHTHPTYDPTQDIKAHAYSNQSIMLQKEFAGWVYVKGARVRKYSDLYYGYNLNCTLDRDRNVVDSYDLKCSTSTLLAQACEAHPEKFMDVLIEMLESSNSIEVMHAYNFTNHPEVIKGVVEHFETTHGKDAIPVISIEQAQKLNFVGKVGVVVSEAMRDILDAAEGKENFYQAYKNAAKSSVKIHNWNDLSNEEKNILKTAAYLMETHPDVEDLLNNVSVVDFATSTINGRYNNGKIEIARAQLASLNSTLHVLIHEVCHKLGSDGTKEHSEAQIEMAVFILSDHMVVL